MIVPTVIGQHVEEAAFQWLLRSAAVHAPHYSLKDLIKLDGLVEAHLDGLRIAGDAGWETCVAELLWKEPGEVFAGAVLAFESDSPDRIDRVLDVAVQSTDLARGAISALGWLGHERAALHIDRLLSSNEPMLRRIGIGAAAVHRMEHERRGGDPEVDRHPLVCARTLKAAGELAEGRLLRSAMKIDSGDQECGFWAAWSGVFVGDMNALRQLCEIVVAGGKYAAPAAMLAARRMHPEEALRWHRQLEGDEATARLAVQVAGAAANPALVPWLLERMSVAELARPAGEAFSSLTGTDLAYLDLETDRPEDFQSGPTENSDDEDVAMDEDEDLPWPDPARVSAWWSARRADYEPGKRYLLGRPINEEGLQHALRAGRQRQRAAAAVELSLLQRGRPLFEVRARGDRQRQVLGR